MTSTSQKVIAYDRFDYDDLRLSALSKTKEWTRDTSVRGWVSDSVWSSRHG